MLRVTAIVLLSFIGMEFVSYLAHRYLYHGPGWFLHKSHHTPRTGLFEWNDVFPLLFAAATITVMLIGLSKPNGQDIVALSIGISMYGILYLVIHDLYVHRRMKSLLFRSRLMQRIKKAHMIHHTYGGEPYGLLLFPLPERLKKELKSGEGV